MKFPIAESAGTEKVSAWLWPPESTNGPDGCDVTPAGSPVSASATVPVNPFRAAMEMDTAGLVVPKVALTCAGDTDKVKSLAEVTVNGSGAECVSVPLVPFAITAKLPAAADAGTASVTTWLAPPATAKGDAGDVVLPTGRPDSEMDTEPVKPFCPVAETVNVEAAPPACCVTLLGEIAIAKS